MLDPRKKSERDQQQWDWYALYRHLGLERRQIDLAFGISERTRRKYERDGNTPGWYPYALSGLASSSSHGPIPLVAAIR